MESKIVDTIRNSLFEKRQNLSEWLRATPAQKRRVHLGPADERAVQAHLHVIDTALDRTALESFGQCEVCHEDIETDLLEIDYTCCVCLDHLSIKERRLLEEELELSQAVQRALLPQQVPTIPGLDLAVFSRPGQIVGGDYFDFSQFRDGARGLAIADVAGHGVAAGLLMASVQTALRTLTPASNSPADVLEQLNRFFIHNIHFTTFVTLFLGRFEQTAGTLTYSNAGHNPPLIFRRQAVEQNQISWLQPTAPVVGVLEEYWINMETISLGRGDIMLLYTDGVTETANLEKEEFGQERLAAVIRNGAHLSARALVRTLYDRLQEFSDDQPLEDDVTIIACKVDQ